MSAEGAPEQAAAPAVSDEQRKYEAIGKLFDTMGADPKYRQKVLGLIKEYKPDTYIPELEYESKLDERLKEHDKGRHEELEALKKELGEVKGRIARQDWASRSGMPEDELVEVEALAKEAGITKGETAIEFYQMRNRLGQPRATPAQKESDDYLAKIRKISPKDGVALKRAAIEEGSRLMRQAARSRRAG